MAQYRKKSDPIEAEQFHAERTPWPDGVLEHNGRTGIYTMAGFRYVYDGDWIITNPDGDWCKCVAVEFEKAYEQVEDPEHV